MKLKTLINYKINILNIYGIIRAIQELNCKSHERWYFKKNSDHPPQNNPTLDLQLFPYIAFW